jgi:hypothetical protein
MLFRANNFWSIDKPQKLFVTQICGNAIAAVQHGGQGFKSIITLFLLVKNHIHYPSQKENSADNNNETATQAASFFAFLN